MNRFPHAPRKETPLAVTLGEHEPDGKTWSAGVHESRTKRRHELVSHFRRLHAAGSLKADSNTLVPTAKTAKSILSTCENLAAFTLYW